MGDLVNVHQLTRLLGSWDDGAGNRADRLAGGLRSLIISGRLPAGSRLPSEREFAIATGLARTTVGHALDLLREDGSLSSRTGVGTFVSSMGSSAVVRGDARLQSFLENSLDHRLDLRSAALHAVPMVSEELGSLTAADYEPLMHSHGYLPEGLPAMREAVARYYTKDGLPTVAEQVLVTSGGQQAVHLVAKCFLEAGDVVLVEEPTYRGAIESFRAAGARLHSIPSGEHGIDIEKLEEAMRRRKPKLLFIMSTAHNPTGSCLSAERRQAIGDLANELGVLIVDEASTSDTLTIPRRPPPLSSFSERVITIGSASKGFWGGLRVGWIRADRQMLGSLVAAKGVADLGTAIPSQLVTTKLLARIDEARRYRRETLLRAAQEVMEDLAAYLPEWRPYVPSGGASLWVRLPSGASATSVAELARRAHVDILPGPTFSATNDMDDHLRIAFSGSREVVALAVQRLAAIWKGGKGHFR